jgi:hypothetical protein
MYQLGTRGQRGFTGNKSGVSFFDSGNFYKTSSSFSFAGDSDQTNVLGFPRNKSVNGCKVPAIPGRNLR